MTRSLAETKAAVDSVEGWLSDDQIERLHAAARRARAGELIVEIGSFRGRSTIVLASAASAGVEVVAIDPHAGNDRGPNEFRGFETEAHADSAAFRANLRAAGVTDRVRHVDQFSAQAHGEVNGGIAVLFIDGAHRYRPALSDIRDWGARVADGGTMLIHDAFSSIGVTAAICRALVVGRRFRYVGRSRSLVEYRADLGNTGRGVNAVRQFAQLPWFAKNVALKVLLALGLGGIVGRLAGHPVEWPY
jgi:predicted O-methyltransferase YrrM